MQSKLKEAREIAGYSIEYVAEKLNIRKQYLIALEEGRLDAIPGKVYIEGYTKIYHKFLGIDCQSEINDTSSTISKTTCQKTEGKENYSKYLIYCSIMLLILIVAFYNNLKYF